MRVFAASYSPTDRGAIERYLAAVADLQVVGTAHRLRDLLQVLPDPGLDVLLLNRDLPGFADPLAQLRRIRTLAPALPIVYLAPDEPALDTAVRREGHLGPMRLLRGAFSGEELLEALAAAVRLAPAGRCITWIAPRWGRETAGFMVRVAQELHGATAMVPVLVDWDLGTSALTAVLLGSDGHAAWPHALENVLADGPAEGLRHAVSVDAGPLRLMPGLFSPARRDEVTADRLEELIAGGRGAWVLISAGPDVHDAAVGAAIHASDAVSWLVDSDDPVARAWLRRSRGCLHLRPEQQETITPWGRCRAGTEGLDALAGPQRSPDRLASAVVSRLLSTPTRPTRHAARLVAHTRTPERVDPTEEGGGSP